MREFRGTIKLLSAPNLLCWKVAAVCRKMATSCVLLSEPTTLLLLRTSRRFIHHRRSSNSNVEQFKVFVVAAAVVSGHVTAARGRRRHDESSQSGVERPAYFRHAQSLVGLSTPTSGHDTAHFRRTAAGRQRGAAGSARDALDHLNTSTPPHATRCCCLPAPVGGVR